MKSFLNVKHKLFAFFFFVVMCISCGVKMPRNLPYHDPPSHELWDELLKKYVNEKGFVNYKAFQQDTAALNEYLNILSNAHPQRSWSRNEQMAYWINAYNAFTIKLVLDHYPINSIRDIKNGIPFVNTVWDIKFIEIQGQKYDLNNIEHGILRKHFKDARIHAAVNCASYSCPPLRREAYVGARLDEQLDDAMRRFINDPERNRITPQKAELSKIFSWFSGDFKKSAGSVRKFVNRYAQTPIGKDTPIEYLDYSWQLNDASAGD